MIFQQKKKNYRGEICKTCSIPITTGSKTGFCKKHCTNRPNHTEESREKIRQAKLGPRNPMYGKIVPESVREKISRSMKGELNHSWKGGVTDRWRKERASWRLRFWRNSVFKRDDYTCVFCGKRGGKLNADHIKSFALFPELRTVLSNGRTLCFPCHTKTESYGRKIKS
jgi:5-methylcytosine-specific restriction endonuclease McrA